MGEVKVKAKVNLAGNFASAHANFCNQLETQTTRIIQSTTNTGNYSHSQVVLPPTPNSRPPASTLHHHYCLNLDHHHLVQPTPGTPYAPHALSRYSHYTGPRMKYSDAIILTVVLVVAFCIFFGWCLYKSCSRVIAAELQELAYRKDAEARAATAAAGGTGKGGSKD